MTAIAEPAVAGRRSEVEALRGVAALGVLLGHCWGTGHGYDAFTFGTRIGRLGLAGGEGLALFFALSGYLLTRMLVRSRPPTTSTYLRHRVARILPTWWFVLAALLLVHDDGVPVHLWWRFPLLLQGFWSDTVLSVDAPAWTLAVEAQFYLLLPLLALVLRTRAAWWALLVLTGGSLWVALDTVVGGHPSVVWRYSLPANLVYFVPGIALAVAQRRTGVVELLQRVPHPRALLLAASLPFWLSFVFFPRTGLMSAAGAGLVVAAVALPLDDGRTVRVLRSRALVTLGTLSFGIYLWHEPLTEVLHAHGVHGWLPLIAVVLPLSLALAAVSHVLVERPFLRMRDSWHADTRTRRLAVTDTVTAAALVVAAAAG